MKDYDKFKQLTKRAAKRFCSLKKGTVRIVTHLDADGIASASILIRALEKLHQPYKLSVLSQLGNSTVDELKSAKEDTLVFTDLGSGSLSLLNSKFAGRNVFVLDHHVPEADFEPSENVVHLNPHLAGIDGTREISGSGVVYFFTNHLIGNSDMAHIALIGAIGDGQSRDGFSTLNQEILQDAINSGTLKLREEINLFGMQTRPLHKLLEYSTGLKIPGVTGDSQGALKLMDELRIPHRIKGKRIMMQDLSKKQIQALQEAIISKRRLTGDSSSILSTSYILTKEDEGTPFRDAKEFSTLLNSAGRLGNAELGVRACMGDEESRIESLKVLKDYKRKILNAMNWYKSSLKDDSIQRGDNYLILNAKTSVPSTIIGTLASIISKSGRHPPGTFIMSLARSEEGFSKVSLRYSGSLPEKGIDLSSIVQNVVKNTGGDAGGHRSASGAIIPTDCETKFIEYITKEFCKLKEFS